MPEQSHPRPVPMPAVTPAVPPVGIGRVTPRTPPVPMPTVPGPTGPAGRGAGAEAGTETPISADQIRAWIDLGVEAVLRAAPIALRHFRTAMPVDDKRSRGEYDPVTVADRDVETEIRDHLGRHLPGHRVLGEEHPDAPGDPRVAWIIDPIDGTRAFLSGLPTWGTLLGLVVDGVAVAGVMHQPFTDETFVADPVRGSRLLHHGEERLLATRAVPAGLADAVLYSTHPSTLAGVGALAAYETIAERVRLPRWGGDCYAYAMLAAGCIDVIIEGDLMSYDVAAMIPIVERAGGVITDLAGRIPVDGGEVVIASGDPRLHAEVLALLRAELGPRGAGTSPRGTVTT